jgi:hypothetical protein
VHAPKRTNEWEFRHVFATRRESLSFGDCVVERYSGKTSQTHCTSLPADHETKKPRSPLRADL